MTTRLICSKPDFYCFTPSSEISWELGHRTTQWAEAEVRWSSESLRDLEWTIDLFVVTFDQLTDTSHNMDILCLSCKQFRSNKMKIGR